MHIHEPDKERGAVAQHTPKALHAGTNVIHCVNTLRRSPHLYPETCLEALGVPAHTGG